MRLEGDKMNERKSGGLLKALGSGAGSALAVCALFGGLVSFFGGHMPPWATYAWGETLEHTMEQNALAVQQLRTIIISEKVAALELRVAKSPDDLDLRKELAYWRYQLQLAEASTLKQR